ncbi:MAG: polymorphic toxin-type HINT domain-containing protein [Pirellulales bacterium]
MKDAVAAEPKNQLAHWQLGEVQVDGRWLSADAAQVLALQDPVQAEYRHRRAAVERNVTAQAKLARWCRDNTLADEAQLHWAVVLSLDPTNKEALRALDKTWKDGQLVDRSKTFEPKRQSQAAKSAAKRWEPIIAKWRRAVAGHDVQAHDAALDEIRAIREIEAIPSMEAATLGRDANHVKHAEECLHIALAFIDALEKMPQQLATESLVRHAVFSPGVKARRLSIEKLKARDQADFVPMLLSGLAMPLESSFDVSRSDDGSVRYTHSLYREGQEADWAHDFRASAAQYDVGGRLITYDVANGTTTIGPPVSATPAEQERRQRQSNQFVERYENSAASIESSVAAINASTEIRNASIMNVLHEVTGAAHETPRAWWDWWKDKTGYSTSERPVEQYYDSEYNHYYYGYPQYASYDSTPRASNPAGGITLSDGSNIGRRMGFECFGKGTPVWTKSGRVPIENVALGDFVLAQDISTGELKYKPVLGKTVRPPSPLVKIKLANEQFIASVGHPFWVPGAGWRMAKELETGVNLHCTRGVASIESIESVPDDESFNLIVGEFNTYFVGERGVLVHDNTPRRPAPVIVPGVAKN